METSLYIVYGQHGRRANEAHLEALMKLLWTKPEIHSKKMFSLLFIAKIDYKKKMSQLYKR